jgi:hypothetical protein
VEAQGGVAERLQVLLLRGVANLLRWLVVDTAVYFDGEMALGAVKIDDETRDRVLPPKLQAVNPPPRSACQSIASASVCPSRNPRAAARISRDTPRMRPLSATRSPYSRFLTLRIIVPPPLVVGSPFPP